MYASVRIATAKPGRMAETIKKVNEGFVPIISQSPGFVTYYLVDIGNDKAVTVSIFNDQAGAEESGRRAQAWVSENLAPLMAGPLEVMVGEVAIHKSGK